MRLVDPNDFLDATFPFVRPLFSWFGAILYVTAVAYGCILAGLHWSALTDNVSDRVLSAENIVLLLVPPTWPDAACTSAWIARRCRAAVCT